MGVKTYTVKAPAPWIDPLINGDYSGVTYGDEYDSIIGFENSILPDTIIDVVPNSGQFISGLDLDAVDKISAEYVDYIIMTHDDQETVE